MKIIGIIGGIGAGKSTVVALMNELSPMTLISADQIGHDILLKSGVAYHPVVQTFGLGILNEEGEIDRSYLGQIVFNNPLKLKQLNAITHPIIKQCITEQIHLAQQVSPHKHILLEAALLIEGGLIDLTEIVIAVYANPEIRLSRVVKRDQLDQSHILKRMASQKHWEEMKAIANYTIDNSFSLEDTIKQIEIILNNI